MALRLAAADDRQRLVNDLDRMETQETDVTKASPQFAAFAIRATSPLAANQVAVVSTASDRPHQVFAMPVVNPPNAFKDGDDELCRKALDPRVLLHAVARETSATLETLLVDRQSDSRTLAQMPMSTLPLEVMPNKSTMVTDPLNLQYEIHLLDNKTHHHHQQHQQRFASSLSRHASSSQSDSYVRGQAGKTPFAPGGETLVKNEDDPEAPMLQVSNRSGMVMNSPEEQQRDVLVLQQQAMDQSDYETLERLIFTAPGLNDCLTLDDILAKDQAQDESIGKSDPQDQWEHVGTNPKELLGHYLNLVEDEENVLQIECAVRAERGLNAMKKENTLSLEKLLSDELEEGANEFGFAFEDSTPSADKENEAIDEHAKDKTGEKSTTKASSTVTDEMEPEEAVETLLSEVNMDILSLETAASSTGATSVAKVTDWASEEIVDVSNFRDQVPQMAMEYSFELDSFQKQAVIHLENHDSVFVAAHTSAGKTVVAEYAIGMSQKHMTRTIYTSPIKALSNQKYRDFRNKFGADNVGLITGDVSINPEASCLVMTTEILRSMLYRGADIVRDIEWVIFDEIHYINDSERGVVWEEVIIMLPEHIGMVFLSATTPNTFEFSDWIGRTKRKKIHVISTVKRPVPLEHFLYVNKDFVRIMDKNATYNPSAYSTAVAKLHPASDKKTGPPGRGGGGRAGGTAPPAPRYQNRHSGGDSGEWTKFVNLLKDKNLLPVVVFAFSKRLCEESAGKLSRLDLSSASERSEIHLFLESSISRLNGSDRQLPQVLTMKEMLKRGIGVHHGGLLPIIKEMVEILFARGLVKVLFATETFAMGVNMPARTVVFNGIRKHDGKSFRDLLPGEYTQMAGRAGRRGLDTVGTVVIACWSDVPDVTSLRLMLVGKATKLESQFRLTYNMILNLMRVEDMTVEDMMKRSFSEFRTQKALSSRNFTETIGKARKMKNHLEQQLHERFPEFSPQEFEDMKRFVQDEKHCKSLQQQLVDALLNSRQSSNAIAAGRVLLVNVKGLPSQHPALVLRAMPNVQVGDEPIEVTGAGKAFASLVVLCLCPPDYKVPSDTTSTPQSSQPLGRVKSRDLDYFMGSSAKKGGQELEINAVSTLAGKSYAVLKIGESNVATITCTKATNVNCRTILSKSSRNELALAIELLVGLEADAAALEFVNPLSDLKINELLVAELYDEYCQMVDKTRVNETNFTGFAQGQALTILRQMDKLQSLMNRVVQALSNDSLSLFPDFQQRLRVLQQLGYLSRDAEAQGVVVQVKGKVACEINTCEEILLTEMIFENVLADLEPEEIVAVLSALICQEKTQNEPKVTMRLEHAKDRVQRLAECLAIIQMQQQLDVDVKSYCKNVLNFGLIEVVYEWARGMPFKEICHLTDIPEGSIVRCITRLEEVCREVRNAARIIGDPRLYRKMEVASEAIKRDVVFASSLYLA